jgi:hypothetical protein
MEEWTRILTPQIPTVSASREKDGKQFDDTINNTNLTCRVDGCVSRTSTYSETQSMTLKLMRSEEQWEEVPVMGSGWLILRHSQQ